MPGTTIIVLKCPEDERCKNHKLRKKWKKLKK